jgi:hypothetical protein
MHLPLAPANRPAIERRSKITMKTTLLAAVAAVGLGIAPVFAADMQSNSGYMYPNFWGTATAQQAPSAKAPAQSNGATIGVYATQSGRGTWLFPPNPNGDGTNG